MQKTKMSKNTHISFTTYHKQLPAPFGIYADFECLTVPISEKHANNTDAYQEHKTCGYGYMVDRIYATELRLNRTNSSDTEAFF